MRYIIDEEGVVVNEIGERDVVRIMREGSVKRQNDKMSINIGEEFIKLYTSVLKDLISENLTSNDLKIILVCLENLKYESGAIMYDNGAFLKYKDFMKATGMNKRSVLYAIDKLVKLKILHKGKTGREWQLFMNPFVFMKGQKINKTLYQMFKKSKWNKLL